MSDTSTVQFRSIPFAQVSKRFAPCTPLSTIPAEFDGRPHRDFTQFGAACPQLGGSSPEWFEAYGGPLEDDRGIAFDEFTCLTVSVSVPESHLATLTKDNGTTDSKPLLPVMVYVHGGGAQDGIGHVDGLHSSAPLTAYSASLSLPVVTVNIGYRLNWLGSLVCQDMLDEYCSDPSVSRHGPFNHYLQDQRAAFTWIRKFIGGFGGDADNVTAYGESAGSIFLVYHICGSAERLFNRAILQSGVIMGPLSFEQKEAEYQGLLRHFNVTAADAGERLAQLRNIPAEELIKYPGGHLSLFVDDVPDTEIPEPLFSRGPATYTSQMSLIPSCPWLEDVILGDDFWEGHVLMAYLRLASAPDLMGAVKSAFPGAEGTKLLEAYHLPSTLEAAQTIDSNLFFGYLTYFIGDLCFSSPYQTLTNIMARKVNIKEQPNETHTTTTPQRRIYRYAFGLSNPFPGSIHNFVAGHHFVEILFIFLTLLDRYPHHRDNWLARQALETARRWVTFADGNAPWDEYVVDDTDTHTARGDQGPDPVCASASAKLAICDDLQGWTIKTTAQDEEDSKSYPWGPRRYAGWRAFDAASKALRTPGMGEDVYANEVHGARTKILGYVFSLGRDALVRGSDGGVGDGKEKAHTEGDKGLEAEVEVQTKTAENITAALSQTVLA